MHSVSAQARSPGERNLWIMEVDAKTLGIPAAVQIFRIDRKVQTMRRAKKSLPDWQRKNMRNPNALIKLLVG